MNLIIEPGLIEWLKAKDKNVITVGVIVSRGGGCCGGCAFTEIVFDYGAPKIKEENYLLFEEDGLKVFVAKILSKKTDQITLFLKGSIFKRLALKGYDSDCSWKQ